MRSVSIIIPTYARPELDPGLVQALADQTYAGPVQVIVVDNNAEPTVKVPENWISVHEPTPGSYAARNAGVAARMFNLLAAEGINIQAISTSEIKVSCLVATKYTELAVRTLHDGFGLGNSAKTAL